MRPSIESMASGFSGFGCGHAAAGGPLATLVELDMSRAERNSA